MAHRPKEYNMSKFIAVYDDNFALTKVIVNNDNEVCINASVKLETIRGLRAEVSSAMRTPLTAELAMLRILTGDKYRQLGLSFSVEDGVFVDQGVSRHLKPRAMNIALLVNK